MSKPTVKIYIGCALTQAPDEFKNQVEALKDQLRSQYEVLDFVGLVNGTAHDVYQSDIQHNVADCDLFVAICDYPAIGLGYELGTAVEKWSKPVLALAQEDAHITRIVLGIDAPNYSLERYRNFSDIPNLIAQKLSAPNLQETAHE